MGESDCTFRRCRGTKKFHVELSPKPPKGGGGILGGFMDDRLTAQRLLNMIPARGNDRFRGIKVLLLSYTWSQQELGMFKAEIETMIERRKRKPKEGKLKGKRHEGFGAH